MQNTGKTPALTASAKKASAYQRSTARLRYHLRAKHAATPSTVCLDLIQARLICLQSWLKEEKNSTFILWLSNFTRQFIREDQKKKNSMAYVATFQTHTLELQIRTLYQAVGLLNQIDPKKNVFGLTRACYAFVRIDTFCTLSQPSVHMHVFKLLSRALFRNTYRRVNTCTLGREARVGGCGGGVGVL